VTDKPYRIELTESFLTRLDAIEAFLLEADADVAFDALLADLQSIVIPNLRRFPRIGRRFLDTPSQSVEALNRLAALSADSLETLCEYLHGDYLMLYSVVDTNNTVYLLSIRHHRQLSFNFVRFWPGAKN
jgi:mRNA-degrading endonuclease RelE of RelBE toxin-antitoxin system